MRDPRKRFLSIDFDILETVFEDPEFTEADIKDLLYAAVRYDLTGENQPPKNGNLRFAYRTICRNMDEYTAKAIARSVNATQAAHSKYSKDKTRNMTNAEMDMEIDMMFPRSK